MSRTKRGPSLAAKQAAASFEQQYGIGAALGNAYTVTATGAASAYQSAAGAARQAFAGGGASLGTATGLPDQTWKVHCVEKLEGGGRGKMEDGTLVQPSGQFMLFLQLKGTARQASDSHLAPPTGLPTPLFHRPRGP